MKKSSSLFLKTMAILGVISICVVGVGLFMRQKVVVENSESTDTIISIKSMQVNIDSMKVVIADFEHNLISLSQLLKRADEIVKRSDYEYRVISTFTQDVYLEQIINSSVEIGKISLEDKGKWISAKVEWLQVRVAKNDSAYAMKRQGK